MEAVVVKIIFSLLFSFLITFYLVPFFSAIAYRFNILDVPDGKIKKHQKVVPYLGGVAVYCGFLCGLIFALPFHNQIFFLLAGSTLLLLLGLVDDLAPFKPYQKFFGQCIVALCFLKAGFYLKEHFFYNIWNMPLSFLWILTIINAFNLVDVMDGLATTIGLGSSISFLIIAAYLGHDIVMILLASFIGPLFAFLWYNRPSASMYLGDAGSLFIGGFLGAIPFLFDWGTYTPYGYLTPIIILAIPLLECVSLIGIRLYKNIPFYKPSPDHFSLYLKANGWKVEYILFYMATLSLFLGIVSFLFVTHLIHIVTTIAIGFVFLFIWIINLLFKR